ncbi:twin-arginine translocase subunit TatC [Alicyclobacillus acidoterrestris]|uniref:twin-arginine translocase subunit TatC n=1 Tax=Alicyclobacillus acidoterrestris TaxID=1450 RepID=UPI003F5359C1
MEYQKHWSEMRRRGIRVLIVFAIAFVLCLAFDSKIYHALTRPAASLGLKLVVLGPGEIVTVLFTLAGWTAIGVTVPYLMYELWQFVTPGLYAKERQLARSTVPLAALLFLAGLCFSWYLIFPRLLLFLVTLTRREGLGIMLQAHTYFSFVIGFCLPFGFAFEGPLVVFVLARLGVITSNWLRKVRKFAYLAIVILGVLISPPELISHLSVTVPMMILYEIGVGIATIVERRRVRNQEASV